MPIATEQELLQELRREWLAAWNEWKTNASAEAAVKLDKIGLDLQTKTAEQIAAYEKRLEQAEGTIRKFIEQGARIPLGSGLPVHKTLGQLFTESQEFKAGHASFSGRNSRIATTLSARVLPAERKVITEAGSGFVLFPQRIGIFVEPPPIPLVMRDLWRVVQLGPNTNAIEYLQEVWTYNADYQVNEGDRKAESTVTWTPKTLAVRTIAHYVKVSRQMWMDIPYIQSTIDDNLIYGVLKKEDFELLFGDNSAGHLWGVMPQAQALAGTVATSNLMDEIMNAITQLGVNGYTATNIVMNPANWGAMQIQKNDQGFYVLGGPPQSLASRQLWGLPVTLSPHMTAGTVLVGQFPATAAIYDRESVTVDIAFENEDDFVRNLVCIRAEERLVFVVTHPKAYVKVTIPPA